MQFMSPRKLSSLRISPKRFLKILQTPKILKIQRSLKILKVKAVQLTTLKEHLKVATGSTIIEENLV